MKQCSLNEEQRESLATYLLGGLSAAAAQAVEAHLAAGCSRCEQEILELRETLALLAYSSPPQSPSESVRTQLFARLSPDSSTNLESGPHPALPLRPAVSGYRTSLNWLVRIAASLIVLMLLTETVYLIDIKNRAHQQEMKIAQLLEQISKKQKIITTMGASRRLIVLDGKLIQATGKAFWDTDKNTWLFYIEKLPPAPKGKTYQLWFITEQQECIGANTFQTDANGSAALHLSTPHKTSPIVATAVSLEPEGGSNQPTGAICLLGPV